MLYSSCGSFDRHKLSRSGGNEAFGELGHKGKVQNENESGAARRVVATAAGTFCDGHKSTKNNHRQSGK